MPRVPNGISSKKGRDARNFSRRFASQKVGFWIYFAESFARTKVQNFARSVCLLDIKCLLEMSSSRIPPFFLLFWPERPKKFDFIFVFLREMSSKFAKSGPSHRIFLLEMFARIYFKVCEIFTRSKKARSFASSLGYP